MPDPAGLPLELFDKILDNILTRSPAVYSCRHHNIKQLYAFSLFNRTWHERSTPKLYSRWTYHGRIHSFLRLWKFLCTIVSNTRIARLVRTLDIREWDPDPLYAEKVCCYDGFPAEDVKLVCNALHLADISAMEHTVLQALHQNDRRPLVALLMTCLPQLTKLNVVVQDIDKCFTQVLNLALRNEGSDQSKRRAFQNLREASFRTPGQYEPTYLNRLFAEDLWPIYRLPNIRKLSISDLVSDEGVADHPNDVARTSPITHLKLAHRGRPCFTLATAQTLLTLPRTLVYLSLYFNEKDLIPSTTNPVSNAELWKMLVFYQNSIEFLDIYRDTRGFNPPVHKSTNSHMGLLHGFKHLKTLYIQPEVLLGGFSSGEKASFCLGDTFPQALESLIFYGDEYLANNRELERQLAEVVYDSQFSHLESIILEDFDGIAADLPRLALEQACKVMDVRLGIAKRDMLDKGGFCPLYIDDFYGIW
ncbi:MAG: hypothetical protein LQ342_005202 [Letrouitia transgressa]|nr:MAG: hypothetical protein LQ342_005202 [Letrouitia transgressa]